MIFKNCTILTGVIGEKIDNSAIYFKKNKIIDVGNNDEILRKYPHEEMFNLDQKLVLPGLTNPYASFYINELAILSKMKDSTLSPYEKFSKIITYFQKIIDDEDLFEKIIKLGSFKSLINGITSTIISLPFTKNIDKIQEITENIGLKVKVSPLLLTENGINEETKNLILNDDSISSISILGLWGLEEKDYLFLKEFISKGKRLKIFIVDFIQEERYCMLKHGKELLDILRNTGLLNKYVDIVFAGNINDNYMDFFSQKGVRFIKSIRTELMEIGYTPNLLYMLGRGIKVAIGTGVIDYSLFNEANTLLTTEKFNNKAKQNILFNEVERTIFSNNFSFTSEEFKSQIGKISPGYEADMTIISSKTGEILLESKTPFTELSFKVGTEFDVFGTVVNGDISIWEGKPKKVDIRNIKRLQREMNNTIINLKI